MKQTKQGSNNTNSIGAYVQGFIAKCAQYNIDPDILIKTAQTNKARDGIINVVQKKIGKLYHGSKNPLPIGKNLRTPTGVSGMDVTKGGVVYLTDLPELAKRYGDVYEIEVSKAIPYVKQRLLQGLPKKKGRYTRGVWVALPEDTSIIRKL